MPTMLVMLLCNTIVTNGSYVEGLNHSSGVLWNYFSAIKTSTAFIDCSRNNANIGLFLSYSTLSQFQRGREGERALSHNFYPSLSSLCSKPGVQSLKNDMGESLGILLWMPLRTVTRVYVTWSQVGGMWPVFSKQLVQCGIVLVLRTTSF